MPAGTDHIRRDAEHSARSDIRVAVMKVIRRMDETSKSHIADRLANAAPGEVIDGTALGREAAATAVLAWFIDDHDLIEAGSSPVLDQPNP